MIDNLEAYIDSKTNARLHVDFMHQCYEYVAKRRNQSRE
jgi:hypothetical protein